MHDPFLKAALEEAQAGLEEGGFPIGAVLVLEQEIISRGRNRRVQSNSCIYHAVSDCFERAGRLRASQYRACTLYTTLSPCDMCAGVILLYHVPRVVIGDNRTFRGPELYLEVRGVQVDLRHDAACKKLLNQYIAANPKGWKEYIGLH